SIATDTAISIGACRKAGGSEGDYASRSKPEEESDTRWRRRTAVGFVVRPVARRRRIDVRLRRHVVVGSGCVIATAPMTAAPSSVVAASSVATVAAAVSLIAAAVSLTAATAAIVGGASRSDPEAANHEGKRD